MRRWTSWLVGAAFATTVGCGSCGGGAKKVELDELDEELADATCSKLYECCTAEEIGTVNIFFGEFDDEESCVEEYDKLIALFVLPSVRQSIEDGRLEYDPKAAGECLAEYRAVSCEEAAADTAPDGAGFACENIFVPLVADGGVCSQDLECIGGTCILPDFDAEEGECGTLPGDGEPCLVNEMDDFSFGECAEGTTCIDDTCVAPKEEGEACTRGSGCISGSCVDDACAPLKADGEDCFSSSECESGFCDTDEFVCGAAADGGSCELL